MSGAQPLPVPQGDRLTWNLEDLAAGSERRIKITVDHRSEANLRKLARALISLVSQIENESADSEEVTAKREESGAAA